VLAREIQAFATAWNEDCAPFEWTATADEILDKVRSITTHMERIVRTTEIGDLVRQAA
jgi:hypothetical protein